MRAVAVASRLRGRIERSESFKAHRPLPPAPISNRPVSNRKSQRLDMRVTLFLSSKRILLIARASQVRRRSLIDSETIRTQAKRFICNTSRFLIDTKHAFFCGPKCAGCIAPRFKLKPLFEMPPVQGAHLASASGGATPARPTRVSPRGGHAGADRRASPRIRLAFFGTCSRVPIARNRSY
jgi:hypothetical protein